MRVQKVYLQHKCVTFKIAQVHCNLHMLQYLVHLIKQNFSTLQRVPLRRVAHRFSRLISIDLNADGS